MGGMKMDHPTTIMSAAIAGGFRHMEALKTWAAGHPDEDMPEDMSVMFATKIHSPTLGREVWVMCLRYGVNAEHDAIIPLGVIDEELIADLATPQGMEEAEAWSA